LYKEFKITVKNLIVGFIIIAATFMTDIHACGAESVELGAPVVPLSNIPPDLGKLSTRLLHGLHSVDVCHHTAGSETFVDKFFKELGQTTDSLTLKQLLASRTLLFLRGVATHEKDDSELQQLARNCFESFLEVLKEANVTIDEILPQELNDFLTAKISEKPVEIQSNLSKSGQRRAKRKLGKERETRAQAFNRGVVFKLIPKVTAKD
jgi:hypothetical protein